MITFKMALALAVVLLENGFDLGQEVCRLNENDRVINCIQNEEYLKVSLTYLSIMNSPSIVDELKSYGYDDQGIASLALKLRGIE